MDDRIITKTLEWVQGNVGEHISKQELASKAQGSDLPEAAKNAINGLPDKDYSRQDVMSELKDALIAHIGQADMAMRGFGGSM